MTTVPFTGRNASGTGKDKGKDTTIGRNVTIGSGAKVRAFTVGDNSKIAANAVVCRRFPNSTCVSAGRIVKIDNKR